MAEFNKAELRVMLRAVRETKQRHEQCLASGAKYTSQARTCPLCEIVEGICAFSTDEYILD